MAQFTKTGILGKMYVPTKIEPDREYPIYLLLSRNPEVSELTLFGVTFCLSPSFIFDILNKRIDLYIHSGIGSVAFGKYSWDCYTEHWFIKNIYSKGGYSVSYNIDERLYTVSLSDLKPGDWQVYTITLKVKTQDENPDLMIRQSIKDELSPKKGYGGLWIPILNDKVGLWIEEREDNVYLAGLYMNELTFRVCAPGLGIVIGFPPSVWIHASGGINEWDYWISHKKLAEIPLSLEEKPSESSWKRIEVFEVRFDRLKPYTKHIETIENGYFEGIALSDEKLAEWVYPQTLYYIKVNGTLKVSDNYQKQINTALYYTKEKGFKKGDKIVGFVKLVTIRTTKEPVTYLSAIGEGYWIAKQPKMVLILDISAPESAYVGEEVEIIVYSNCWMVDNKPLICSYTYNPISDATVEVIKDGITVKTGKTDENGTFRMVFDESGEYSITVSKGGYVPATTSIMVHPVTVTTIPEVSLNN